MKSFNVVIRVHNVPDAYSSRNMYNIINGLLANSPWEPAQLSLYVEQLRHMPDLRSSLQLSEVDMEYLTDLRDIMTAQRDNFNTLLQRISHRLDASYAAQAEENGVATSPLFPEEESPEGSPEG
jgi:hypothetical protein